MTLWKQALLRRLHAPTTDPADGGKGGGAAPPAPAPHPDTALMDDAGAFGGGDGKGKGGKTPAPPAPPERVKVKVGDNELETDAASAAAINSLLAANAQMTEFVRKGYKPAEEKPPTKPADYDYETQLFVNPKEAIARLKAEAKAEIMAEVSAAYTQAESKKDFWSGFYAENEDLRDEKFIVEAVLGREWAKLKDLPPADAAKKLSEAAKKELMRLSGGKSPTDPNPRPVEGGGDGKSTPPAGKVTPDNVLSLSEVIRKSQTARRKAQFSKE